MATMVSTASTSSSISTVMSMPVMAAGQALMSPEMEIKLVTVWKQQKTEPPHWRKNLPSIRMEIICRNSISIMIMQVKFDTSSVRISPNVNRVTLRSSGDCQPYFLDYDYMEFAESNFILFIIQYFQPNSYQPKHNMLARNLTIINNNGKRVQLLQYMMGQFCTQGSQAVKIGRIIRQNVQISQAQNQQFNNIFNNQVADGQISVAFVGSLFSRLIGSNIHQSIYLSQSFQVHKEAKLGDNLMCLIEVKESLGKNRYKLATTVQCDGAIVVTGQAIILHEQS